MKKIILIILLAFIITGCKGNKEIPEISAEDIFDIDSEEYYVLFVKDDCAGCERIKPVATKYHRDTFLRPSNPKLYIVNLTDPANKIIIGDEDILDGTSSIDELRLTRTPTLIIIKDGKVTEHHINSTEVGNFFDEAMKK